MKSIVFTIITRNRLHLARVLMQSVATSLPSAGRHVLVIDPAEGLFDPAAEPFVSTFAADLGVPRFEELAFVNDALSLCCLLKPAFALHLLKHTTADVFIYADSDMLFYARPEHLFDVLATAPVALTPHVLSPLGGHSSRRDGHIMRSGAFNAGFFAVRRCTQAAEFLNWWLTEMGRDRQLDAAFCHDQQWLSLAVVYFPWIATLRDPGYNVAYWNIGQRPLARSADGRLLVDGRPLVIFHYSFFKPATPDLLVNRPPLVIPSDGDVLREILCDYAARFESAGTDVCLSWTYLYGFFTDGKLVVDSHRKYYLDRVWHDPDHRGSPFDPAFCTRSYHGLKSVYNFNSPLPRLTRFIRRCFR